ncbi:MAG: vitamin K epoxide reductase family protein [Gemmatimonadaceae bacterium]
MTRRMATALVALVGLFVALYLWMYKAGFIGALACGAGQCETVQLSRWATLLALPVAAWGVGFYAVVFIVALLLVQERFAESRGLALALLLLTGWGVLFSGWLTYLELFVIHAICRWCVVSAVIAGVLFVLAFLDWRRSRSTPA